jgi:hypothetical protein
MTIELLNNYIVQRFQRILMDGQPITVYGPDAPEREEGETVWPHLAVSIKLWQEDARLSRHHEEVFVPSETTQTITVPKEFAGLLRATVVGTEREPFTIVENENDVFGLSVGKDDVFEADQSVRLIPGDRDAADICLFLNTWLDGITAVNDDGRIKLMTVEPGHDLQLLDLSNSANAVLGFEPGIVRHEDVTGPESWSVKRYPTPWRILYQVDLRTTVEAHAIGLTPFVLDSIPDGHWPIIAPDFAPVFHREPPQILDELAKPEYWRAFRWWVGPVWIDRITSYTVQPITEFTLEFE